jgi:hypothetical protein
LIIRFVSRAQVEAKIYKRFQQRSQNLDALERAKFALQTASLRPLIGVVEHKHQAAATIQLHFILHRRRRRLSRFRALNVQGRGDVAARKICAFFRIVLSRRKPPPLPPLMRLRSMHRQLPRAPQAMSFQRAAGVHSIIGICHRLI